MIHVLLNAYAVSPNWGSEPGLGWNWVVNLSKYCKVFVITEGEWRDEIEIAVNDLPQKENIHFYYNPVSAKIRKMCWNQGDWRFYKHYRQWQEKTLSIARDIIAHNRIDVLHQLNMIGYREPGSLWKIDGIPFVWGPVGGYGCTTLRYLDNQPLSVKFRAVLKNILNVIQGKYYPLPNHAMRHASCVMAANSKVYEYIRDNLRRDVVLLNETGCDEQVNARIQHKGNEYFNILWVGKFDYRKQLPLAIRTIAQLKNSYPFVKLHVVGDTNNRSYANLCSLCHTLDIEQNVVWHGRIPNEQVHVMMGQSDVFLFTSIDEGTPHVVLESIQNNLPVVCFDTCGQGDVINENVGIKVPLANALQSPYDFAVAISSLIENPEKLHSMRVNCSDRQKEISWDSKIVQVVKMYKSIIATGGNCNGSKKN